LHPDPQFRGTDCRERRLRIPGLVFARWAAGRLQYQALLLRYYDRLL